MITDSDSLAQLSQVFTGEELFQFRLADQHDLDQFLPGRFQVGDKADLFQYFGGEVLGFVDYQDHDPAGAVFPEQEFVERLVQFAGFTAAGGDAEFPVDLLQEAEWRQCGVENQGGAMCLRRQLPQQGPDDGGLAGTHFAGEFDETGAGVDGVEKVGEGLLMKSAQKKEFRVWGQGERWLPKAEVVPVHYVSSRHAVSARQPDSCWFPAAGSRGSPPGSP